ncbi:MAG: hypothetical protein IPL23_30555 [Saprospiraceae bacterium]|nr:hypothetical protein [Saprospiraceae bacterium]
MKRCTGYRPTEKILTVIQPGLITRPNAVEDDEVDTVDLKPLSGWLPGYHAGVIYDFKSERGKSPIPL